MNLTKPSEFIHSYWKYYEILENDFLALEKYVSFEQENFKTYSSEFIKIYQTICSEVDVVAKVLCGLLNDTKSKKFDKYQSTITSHLPLFCSTVVNSGNYNLTFNPWHEWKTGTNTTWWKLYNKVKHNRLDICEIGDELSNQKYYQTANLENVFNSLAGLFVLEFYCLLILCKSNKNYSCLEFCCTNKLFIIQEFNQFEYSYLGQNIIDEDRIKEVIDKRIT